MRFPTWSIASVGRTSAEICREGSSARTFFTGILMWGVGIGCFNASFHNFIVDEYHISGLDRGILEFMREMPGVLLVCVLAAMSRFSDWRVLRIGTVISILAAGLLLLPVPWAGAVALITFWSLGDHTVMPVRQSLALMLAKDGKGGESLGFMTSMINAGTVIGSLIVATVFFGGRHLASNISPRALYDVVFVLVMILLSVSVVFSMRKSEPGERMRRRPRFYFDRKYAKFYALELFYGARKQVFFTFGPFVLITVYGMRTQHVAMLFALSAFLTALWGGRLIGRLADCWGYRNIMIWDTVVLAGVCLLYGFAKDLFSAPVALAVVCVNYVMDMILSNCSIATNLYARTLSHSQEELSATLSSGISINHVVTVFYSLLGGYIFDRFGPGVLFATAAVMALCNSAFALTVPKPSTGGNRATPDSRTAQATRPSTSMPRPDRQP